MAKPVFDHNVALAAMCIMEEIVDPNYPDAGTPWQEFRDQNGIAHLRDEVLTKLALACEEAWERAYRRYEEAVIAAPTRAAAMAVTDPGSFDYEFVPFWLRNCVDWSDVHGGPRVLGTTVT